MIAPTATAAIRRTIAGMANIMNSTIHAPMGRMMRSKA
jgi:hypothetical protein